MGKIIEVERIRRIRKHKPCFVGESEQLQDSAGLWWAYDEYTRKIRWLRIKLFGLTIALIPYFESIESVYGGEAEDMTDLLDSLVASKLIPPLSADSRIFEPGCNMGRNLIAIQKRFNCYVYGLDISEQALVIAEKKLRQFGKYKLWYADVLKEDFSRFSDNYFDVIFTRGHLMHIPRCEKKKKYVSELKRMGKVVILVEPVKPGRNTCEYYENGRYCLSWDDWANDYGFKDISDYANESVKAGGVAVYMYSTST